MFYEICFIRGDLTVGLARDVFLDTNGVPLCSDPRLSKCMTYSRSIDLEDGSQVNSFVNKAKLAMEIPDCSIGSFISENPDATIAKRNLRLGLVYYANVKYHDHLGGDGWVVLKPCNENKAKEASMKKIK
ncbi:MAG: hypothetical protein FWF83_00495 [Clostridiales bacterium]|nr:hypothetical protein [Clostridiales bacterium]